MLEQTTITQPDRPPGILEHLSEGMSLVLVFPQLVAIPILLDLYLLLGARISPDAMTSRLGNWFTGNNGANSADAGEWVRGLGDWDMSRLLAFLMPSVLDGIKQSAIYRPFDRVSWDPSMPLAIIAAIGLMTVGCRKTARTLPLRQAASSASGIMPSSSTATPSRWRPR